MGKFADLLDDSPQRGPLALRLVADTPPDKAARAAQLARRYGVSQGLAEALSEDYEAKAKADDAQEALSKAPILRRMVADDLDIAKIVQNDVPKLSVLEQSIRKIGSLGRSFAGGFVGDVFGRGPAGISELYNIGARARDNIEEAILGQTAQVLRPFDIGAATAGALGQFGGTMKEAGEAIKPDEMGFAEDVAAGLGQFGGQALLHVLSGGFASVPFLLGQGADVMAEKVKDDPASQGRKDLAVVGGAAVTAGLEKLALDKIIGKLAVPTQNAAANVLGRIVKAGAIEGATEIAEGVAQDALRIGITNPDAEIDLVESAYEGGVGFTVGGIARAAIEAAFHVKRKRARTDAQAEQAETVAAEIEQLVQAAKAIEVSQLDGTTFAEVVSAMAEEDSDAPTEVWVDGDILTNTLNQAGIGSEILADIAPGIAAQMGAAETGGLIRLPVSEMLRLGENVGTPLADHIRAAEDAPSRAEAREFMENGGAELVAEMEREIQSIAQADEAQASVDRVYEQFLGELNATKRFTGKANQAYAKLLSSYFGATASRLGMTAEELVQKYRLAVRDKSAAGAQRLDQGGEYAVDGDEAPTPVLQTGAMLHHGTAGMMRTITPDSVLFLTTQPREARVYAKGLVPGTRRGSDGQARLVTFRIDGDSNVRAIDDVVEEAIMDGDIDETVKDEIARARKDGGVDFLSYMHPSGVHGGSFQVYVPVYPESLQEHSSKLAQGGQQPLAEISFGANIGDGAVISLLESANLSSFIHEAGHFFLEVHADLATKIQAQILAGASVTEQERKIVDDFNAILKWFEIAGSEEMSALDTWAMMSLDQKREYHERWARGFEVYAFEGKAPSVELEGVFAQFRAWLKQVYLSILEAAKGNLGKALDAKISDDIRQVMGRMLATDQAIEDARARAELGPLFTSIADAQKAGMTLEQYQAYQASNQQASDTEQAELGKRALDDMKWLSGARDRALRRRQKEVEELRREVRMQARAEVMAEPTYVAWQFLTGKTQESEPAAMSAYREAVKAHKEARTKAETAAKAKAKADYLAGFPGGTALQKAQFVSKAKKQLELDAAQAMLIWDEQNPKPKRPMIDPADRAEAGKPARQSDSVDPARDSITEAIAKLGGISQESARKDLGVPADSLKMRIGIRPVFKKEGGRSADDMREALTEYGYLMEFDEFGRTGLVELESAIEDDIGGRPRYSMAYDYGAGSEAPQPFGDYATHGRLNTEMLEAQFGGAPSAPWRVLQSRGMTSKTGSDPEQVAVHTGFGSADAMVKALAEAKPPREEIEARTDAKMLEQYGDITSPEALAQAADDAVHHKLRAKVIASELRALTAAMGARRATGETTASGKPATVNILMDAASSYAESILAAMRIRDIRPSQYTAAEARASKKAMAAFAKADFTAAMEAKRNQLINHVTATKAKAALEEVDKAVRYLRKFESGKHKIAQKHLDQIHMILEQYDLRPATNKDLDRRASLATWVAEQQALGIDPQIPPEVMARAGRTNYRTLTLEDLRGVVDTVKQIEHIGRRLDKVMTARAAREFNESMEELAASIAANGKPKKVARDRALRSRPKQWLDGFNAEHRKLSSYVRQFDGGRDDGPMYELFWRAANERGAWEAERQSQFTKRMLAIYEPLFKLPGGLTGFRSKMEVGGVELTRAGRMAVVLNWGNAQGRQRLLTEFTPQQIQDIFQSLGPTELDAVNQIWPLLDEFWPEIEAKQKRVNGTLEEKVPAIGFVVQASDGTEVPMRGGYYPLKYDRVLESGAPKVDESPEAYAKQVMQGRFASSTTRRGHVEARMEERTSKVRLDLDVITQHAQEVIHDLAWHEWLIDARRIITAEPVANAIKQNYGEDALNQFKLGMEAIAAGDLASADTTSKIMMWSRKQVTRSIMGLSVTTAFLQPFGLLQAANRIGAKHVVRGLAHWGGDAAKMQNSMNRIREKSAFMRHRGESFNREMSEINAAVHGKSKIVRAYDVFLFGMMQKMQLIADIPTWWGQYEKTFEAEMDKAKAAGIDGQEAIDMAEAAAVAQADRAVIEAQSTGGVKDLSQFQRKHPMLSMFFSYFSATQQLVAESTAKTDFKNPRAVGMWIADMTMLVIIPALGPAMILHMLRGGDTDDEDKMLANIAQWQVGYILGMWGLARELGGVIQGFDYSGPPAGRLITLSGDVIKQAGQGELDEPAIIATSAFIGTALGLPMIQIIRSYRGWKAWDEGEAGPLATLVGPPPKD